MKFNWILLFIIYFTQVFGDDLHIAEISRSEWHKAGLFERPRIAVHLIEADSYNGFPDDDDKISEAIEDALEYTSSGLVIIHFSNRTYSLSQPIILNLSSNSDFQNIVFQGEGTSSNGTILNFDINSWENCFKITGYRSCETIIKDFPDGEIAKNALLAEYMIYFNDLNDLGAVKTVMDEYGSKYGDDEEYIYVVSYG